MNIMRIPYKTLQLGIKFYPLRINTHQYLIPNLSYYFTKVSKKQAQKKQKDQVKTKIRSSIQNPNEVDLNIFQQKYNQILTHFQEQINKHKFGNLDQTSFQNIYVKIGGQNVKIEKIAQIAPKNINTCIISPYNDHHLELIQKAIQITEYGYTTTKQNKALVVTQSSESVKEFKGLLLKKLPKTILEYKQKIRKQRSKQFQDLKKYKQISNEDNFIKIQKQLQLIVDKAMQQLEKIGKDKQKQLLK